MRKAEPQILLGLHLKELALAAFEEYSFHEKRKWRFDFAVPEHKLALEIEGGIWTQGRHSRGKGYQEDLHKYQEAAVLGWTVLRFSVEDVLTAVSKSVIRRWMEKNSF